MTSSTSHDPEKIRTMVREGYARVATVENEREAGCGCGPSCCGSPGVRVSEAIGYDPRDLATLPDGADLGLSCGNPTALAALSAGEVVLDLGSGGGLDVFLAGQRVGATGRAIGVDMTAEMVTRARAGVAAYRARTGLENVEFRLGEIEHLPVADASVDVVISNCVLNLSPDKPQVWREIARVLKPGGRVAVSDLVLLRPLPSEVREEVAAWVGCIAGAISIEETRKLASEAGLVDVEVRPREDYERALDSVSDPLWSSISERLGEGQKLAEWVASADITAVRPE